MQLGLPNNLLCLLQAALSQVYRSKNIKDIIPKLDFVIKKSLVQLDSYAKTGEDVQMDENVVQTCLLDAVGQAVFGVDFKAT